MSYAGFNIVDWIIPVNKWTRPGDRITPRGLAIHWTGNINFGADAEANSRFFHNRTGTYGSAHYVLDADTIYRVIPENEMAYHVGAKKYYTSRFGTYPNNQLIGLEICVNQDTDWIKTYDHAVRFAAAICLAHKWLDPWKALIRHYDVTHKDCPLMWTEFVKSDSHVEASVRSMLKKKPTETQAQYEARVKQGKQWIYSMTANGKLGDAGWNQFVSDVADAMNGVYKKPAMPEPPKTIEEKVVYFMGKYFADVDDASWKSVGINRLHEMKTADGSSILAGSVDENGKKVAKPDAPITRAEAALLIERAIRYTIEQVKK